ncbi:putative TTT-family transporter small permease TctB component (plasmid) [Octadecabacter antarcticus 307]|uniref:Putative TTT-family transporter small permease TctB component n=1 Tax=Octadecabacter antarcticus 307 TaxID=391626 RepID=M9RIP7_9RHOB|nr:tripartite tricarboxylate transporter TctB family protein [Octadecabacter antarcticus]AGI70256.1 putative TTT-family transporter small permease TctB component [Octadecabacter antarcticus 307]
MRLAFLLVVLAGAIFYSYVAFVDLSFMTRSGRLGPGFFPRIVGSFMVVFVSWSILDALREGQAFVGEAPDGGWTDTAILIALAVGYAVLLRLFGGLIATVIYLTVTLSLLNRRRYLLNCILALTVPGGVYILFDTVLNANMPPALLDLPF